MADAGENEIKKRNSEPITRLCFIILIIACIAVIGMYINDHYFADDSKTVEYGDSIECDYVGSLYAYYDEGTDTLVPIIFDTNIETVGTDSKYTFVASFDKTKTYSSYSVTIGSGSNVGTFEQQLIGHKVGDTVKVYIAAGEGYPVTGQDTAGTSSTTFGIDLSMPITQDVFEFIFGEVALSDGVNTFNYKINDEKTVTGEATLTDGMVSVAFTGIENNSEFVVATTSCGKVTLKYVDGSWYLSSITDTKTIEGAGIEMVSFSFLGQDYNITSYSSAESFTYNQRADTALLGGYPLYFVVKITSIE